MSLSFVAQDNMTKVAKSTIGESDQGMEEMIDEDQGIDDCGSLQSSQGDLNGTNSESSEEDRNKESHDLYCSLPLTQVEWLVIQDLNRSEANPQQSK